MLTNISYIPSSIKSIFRSFFAIYPARNPGISRVPIPIRPLCPDTRPDVRRYLQRNLAGLLLHRGRFTTVQEGRRRPFQSPCFGDAQEPAPL